MKCKRVFIRIQSRFSCYKRPKNLDREPVWCPKKAKVYSKLAQKGIWLRIWVQKRNNSWFRTRLIWVMLQKQELLMSSKAILLKKRRFSLCLRVMKLRPLIALLRLWKLWNLSRQSSHQKARKRQSQCLNCMTWRWLTLISRQSIKSQPCWFKRSQSTFCRIQTQPINAQYPLLMELLRQFISIQLCRKTKKSMKIRCIVLRENKSTLWGRYFSRKLSLMDTKTLLICFATLRCSSKYSTSNMQWDVILVRDRSSPN